MAATSVSTSPLALCEALFMRKGVFARSLATVLVSGACALSGGALSACAGARAVHVLGGGPGRPGDPEILRDAVRAVQVLGYQPHSLDAVHGTFYVLARTDRTGLTRFTVQCFSDGYVSIVPEGGTVRRQSEELVLMPRLREEYIRLAASIGTSIEVRQ